MKYIFILLATAALLYFRPGSAVAQGGEGIAHAGPLGIYIIAGNALGNESHPERGVIGYTIERKESDENNYKTIAEINAPESKGDLERAFASALNDVPYITPLKNISIDEVWFRLERYHELDSLPLRGSILALRIAAGAAYLDKDVKQGVSYEYRMSIRKEKGNSEEPRTQKITFGTLIAPGEIYHKEKSYADSSSVHLRWHKSDNTEPTAIELYRGTFGNFTRLGIHPMFTKERDKFFYSVVDTTLRSDVEYSYYLQPIDFFGNRGIPSDTIVIRTVNANQIRLPDHIRAIASAAKTSVTLSWQFSDTIHAIGIRIYRGEENSDKFIRIGERSSSYRSFIDSKVTPDRTYLYYLTVITADGLESGRTAKIFAVTQSDRKPHAPFALTAKADIDGVHLKWYSAELNLKGFYLYRGKGFHARLERASDLIAFKDSISNYIDTNRSLSPKSIYCYSVQALSSSDVPGELSDTSRVQPKGETIPPVPFRFDAISSGNSIKLFWDEMRTAEPSVVGYNIYRREQGTESFERLGGKTLSSINNNFTDSTAAKGKKYEYYIRTVDGYGGLSNNSTSVSAQIAETVKNDLPVPSGLHAEPTDEGIAIIWAEILGGDVTSFILYRHSSDSEPKEIATIPASKTTYQDIKVKKGEMYWYSVSSKDSNKNESALSKEIHIRY